MQIFDFYIRTYKHQIFKFLNRKMYFFPKSVDIPPAESSASGDHHVSLRPFEPRSFSAVRFIDFIDAEMVKLYLSTKLFQVQQSPGIYYLILLVRYVYNIY